VTSDPSIQPQNIKFSHPSEEFFARILDYYGIDWVYEPRTFPLAYDSTGRITEAFAPDFYLPQQDLYIELTTLRPKLNIIKNRRIRKMHELYPEIKIKLFRRRDLRNLMLRFGMDQEAEKIIGTRAQNRTV
jgi:hypothetical protein